MALMIVMALPIMAANDTSVAMGLAKRILGTQAQHFVFRKTADSHDTVTLGSG